MKADGWALTLSNAVASEIMGWHRHSQTNEWIDTDGNVKAHWRWSPERNIENAWQVVDKINSMGYGIIIVVFDPQQVGFPIDKVECSIHDNKVPFGLDTKIANAYGNTAQEAICKAALLIKVNKETI